MSAMAVMAREQGVSGVAAAGSAVLSTLVTLATGFAVTVVCGAEVFANVRLAVIAAAMLVVGLALANPLLALAARLARWATGRDLTMPRLAPAMLAATVAGSAVAWLLLGGGFYLLARGLRVDGLTPAEAIAAFVGSYLLGFVAVFAPGGVGVREGAMHVALRQVGLADGEALLLVVASRVWLTLLEILPALLFLARGFASGPPATVRDAGRARPGA